MADDGPTLQDFMPGVADGVSRAGAPLGAGLQNVTKLAIVIDGNGASGTLYVDDIRLYLPRPVE